MLSSIYAKKKHNEDGFTLIELLIIVIIIGILAAIALPIFIDQQKVAVDASVQSDVRNTVTNVVNAQAQESATAKAAVSNANTSIALIAASTKVATKTATELSNVPALGTTYSVQGWNAGGKKYQGTTADPGFEFSSSTGRFTQANAAHPDGVVADGGNTGGSTGGSGSSAETPESATYFGSTNNIYVTAIDFYNSDDGYGLNFATTSYDGSGERAFYNPAGADKPVAGSNFGPVNGLIGDYDLNSYSHSLNITDIKAYNSSNQLVNIDLGIGGGNAGARPASGSQPKGAINVGFGFQPSSALVKSQIESLKGGKLVMTVNGAEETLPIWGNASIVDNSY